MGVVSERETDLKQKIVMTHGSSSVPLVLLHPGLLSGGISESFKTFLYLYILGNRGINAY